MTDYFICRQCWELYEACQVDELPVEPGAHELVGPCNHPGEVEEWDAEAVVNALRYESGLAARRGQPVTSKICEHAALFIETPREHSAVNVLCSIMI